MSESRRCPDCGTAHGPDGEQCDCGGFLPVDTIFDGWDPPAETTALVLAGLTDWLADWGQAQRDTEGAAA